MSLLEKIEDFCRKANIAESTFGYLVVNDGKLCSRLRNGKDVTMNTANKIQMYIRKQMPEWRENYDGVENMVVAVMGCIVNGPGESKHANLGISLPGTGEEPAAPVFIDGEKAMTLRGKGIAEEFQRIVDTYVDTHYEKRI